MADHVIVDADPEFIEFGLMEIETTGIAITVSDVDCDPVPTAFEHASV